MSEQSRAQTRAFLVDTKNKMKVKLAEAETANIKSTNEIQTFTAAIASIDLAIEAHDKQSST